MTLAVDYLHKLFKHIYFKCGNIVVSYTAKIQRRQSGNLANMLKMPVNGVSWSLLKKVPQAPKYLEYPSTQVPQVHDCLECLECPK